MVFPAAKGGFGFRGMGILIVGQFRVGDAEVVGWRIPGLGGELLAELERTNIGGILVAHAILNESRTGDGYKILRGLAIGPAKGESVFTASAVGLKSQVLQNN